MPKLELSPRDIQCACEDGFKRMNHRRRARAMFLRSYVGQYYQENHGMTGDEPINLTFNAIQILVPNLIMNDPKMSVFTDYPEQEPYSELLELAINNLIEDIELVGPLRAWLTDSLFGMGIMKVGLKSSGQFVPIDDNMIDPGQIYAEVVDMDNFTADPSCVEPLFRDAGFLGNMISVPRQYLLDRDIYDHALVEKLPSIAAETNKQDKAADISKRYQYGFDYDDARDVVRVCEVWVPEANALVTIPDPRLMKVDDYISMEDYYGPDEGPYSFLATTQPVPGNPFPVAPVGIWYDLHRAANRIFRKALDQAERQKDVILYRPDHADEAEDVRDALDGEFISSTDPTAINSVSFGGQNRGNEQFLGQLQTWFSYMAGNIEQLGGIRSESGTATQAQIIQGNANVRIEDARNIVYKRTAEVAKKLGWYLHTDPLIDMPLTKRKIGGELVHLRLTPEQRRGEFIKFIFRTVPRSMTRMDPQLRAQKILQFATNVIPSGATAAQICQQMGVPFNFSRFIIGMAEEFGLADWIPDVFHDPELLQRLALQQMMGPQPAGKAAVTPGTNFVTGEKAPSPFGQQKQQEQESASMSQEARREENAY